MLGVCSCGKVKSKAADEVNAVALSAAGADDKAEADLGALVLREQKWWGKNNNSPQGGDLASCGCSDIHLNVR